MVGCLLAALKLNEGKKVCKKCFCYLLTGPVAPVCSLTQLADDCGEQMEQRRVKDVLLSAKYLFLLISTRVQ